MHTDANGMYRLLNCSLSQYLGHCNQTRGQYTLLRAQNEGIMEKKIVYSMPEFLSFINLLLTKIHSACDLPSIFDQ